MNCYEFLLLHQILIVVWPKILLVGFSFIKPFPWSRLTKALYQAFDLLDTTTTTHRCIGHFFYIFHCCGAIDDGIDDIHLGNVHTGTEIFIQVLFKNGWKFIEGICIRISFQDINTLQ